MSTAINLARRRASLERCPDVPARAVRVQVGAGRAQAELAQRLLDAPAVQDDTALWGYAVHFPGLPAAEQIGEGAIAVGCNMLREPARRRADEVLSARTAVTGVALALGCAETSALDHAFRRWSGQRPSDWRKDALSSAAGRY